MEKMIKKYLNSEQQEQLLNTAIISGDFIFASGKHANLKFDFDLIDTNSDLFSAVVAGLASCVRNNFSGYNGILTIANGATRLGEPLSRELGVAHVQSAYTVDENGIKRFTVSPEANVDQVVIIDDVFTRGTNATKVATAAEQYAIEVLGVAVVLDRSGESLPSILSRIAVASVIQHHELD